MRAVIIDAEGRIVRTVQCAPNQVHLQAGPGEAVFALTEGDGGQIIDDAVMTVSADGDLTAPEAAPHPPQITLQFVPT